MRKSESVITGLLIMGLTIVGLLLLVLGLSGTGVLLNETGVVDGSSEATETPQPSEKATPEQTTTIRTNQQPEVVEAVYSKSDNGFITKLLTGTGSGWKINVYRNETLLTTIIPQPHTDSNGKEHPTTAKKNPDTNISKNKSFVYIGSRIDSGSATETPTDDVYGLTLLIPNVGLEEHIRIEYVYPDGETADFYTGKPHPSGG